MSCVIELYSGRTEAVFNNTFFHLSRERGVINSFNVCRGVQLLAGPIGSERVDGRKVIKM